MNDQSPSPNAGKAPEILQSLIDQAQDPKRRIVFRGATIISMDPEVGDFVNGDLLIEGRAIKAVGQKLAVSDAIEIDAANRIIVPGFVDAHRHSWIGALRGLVPDADVMEYLKIIHTVLGTKYRPEDMYIGNLVVALNCIDGGVTCIVDNSNNTRTPEHSDAAIQALLDSGIRAVHASGAPRAAGNYPQWPKDLERIQKKYFSSDDGVVKLGMFGNLEAEHLRFAREHGLRYSTEALPTRMTGWDDPAVHAEMGPFIIYNHCNGLPDSAWQRICDTGGMVNINPRSDAAFAIGEGYAPLQRALDLGLRPSIGVDIEVSYGSSMFTEMSVAFTLQRARAQNQTFQKASTPSKPITYREILRCATVNGADQAAFLKRSGTLTPGKDADFIVIRTDQINMHPLNNAVAAVVGFSGTQNVDTVLIAGSVKKFDGKLVGVDMPRLLRTLDESRRHVFDSADYQLDLLR